MIINFVGWYNRNNCGDEAFKDAHKILFPDDQLVYTTESIINNADLYVLGGGDVIKDFYLKHLKDKPFHVLGAGLGYLSELESLKQTKVQELWLRNFEDVNKSLDQNFNARYCPDLAFLLQPSDKPSVPLAWLPIKTKRKKLGVILADTMNPSIGSQNAKEISYGEYFKWELAETLTYMQQWYELIFIPLSNEIYHFDLKMALDVANRMSKLDGIIIDKPYNVQETIDLISQLDLVITMKFHGLIFSVLNHIPVINIGVTRKTNLFCQEHNLNDISVQPYTLTKSRILQAVKNAEQDAMQTKLQTITADKREQWELVIRHIKKSWREGICGDMMQT